MNEELKAALEELNQELDQKTQALVKEKLAGAMEEARKGLVSETEYKATQEKLQAAEEKAEALQKHLDQVDASMDAFRSAMKANEAKESPLEVYNRELKKTILENGEEIKALNNGRVRFEVKATMTLGTDLTGDPVKTYGGVVPIPSQMVNFADLVPNLQSATGVYTYYVETTPTGAPAKVDEGADKPEVSYKFTETTCVAQYIGGLARFSKVMAQDLPFLSSFLPAALRRDYFKAENADFYATLTAAATGTSTGTGGVTGIIEDIGVLGANDYEASGIVLNPADWAALAAVQVPGNNQSAITSFINGQMFLAGVPVFKASWVTAGEYVVGDWFWAKKIVVDGLRVEFFEQDRDNVQKNLITARVESRVCMAVERPDAFIVGEISPAT